MTTFADTSTYQDLNKSRHLEYLESEALFIIREVAGEFERPVLLFSGGKDSIVLLHLLHKAFSPASIPFSIMHVDTGHNFDEVIEFRDQRMKELGLNLIVASVQEAIDSGRATEETGPYASRNLLQTIPLLDAINKYRFDGVLGGARRDEEKSRAKERVFSLRDAYGQWDARRQRPELWNLYNGKHRQGEHMRVFPISNWTELDVWQYIAAENIEVPSIYFAHEREVFERNGMLLSATPYIQRLPYEQTFTETVRYRTVGDMTCTAAIKSSASYLYEIIDEVASSRITERGASRADDKRSETAMEDRKRQGYF